MGADSGFVDNTDNSSSNTVSVIGVGRVGLPLSLVLCEAGFTVYGIDVNTDMISKLLNKQMPFMEKDADSLLQKHSGTSFIPTTDSSKIGESDYVIITLGTPVDDHLNPDFKQLDSIFPKLVKNIKTGQTLILRSTVSPGTTEFIKDKLEKETKLVCGKDFYLAFCPERIAQGNAIAEIKEIPQIIGGIDDISSDKAEELFIKITSKISKTDAKSAELAKIFTNMYRYINFAISNEFAILAMEHNKNIYEILELVNKDYKRANIPSPGFTAGPCLYKDGFFLLNNIPFNELISVSWRINENLPLYLLNKIKQQTPLKNKKAVILGMAFKKNSDDTRNSLSYKLKKALIREQCDVVTHDPYIKELNTNLKETLKDAEIVFIAMNHDQYKDLSKEFLSTIVAKDCTVCDLWNLADGGEIIYKV
jgi:UDP-N-acetyl-D-mannosaminuronic acid dehydrogenase